MDNIWLRHMIFCPFSNLNILNKPVYCRQSYAGGSTYMKKALSFPEFLFST